VPALGLVGAAVLGKLAGTAGPALIGRSWRSATVLGVSMVPRAEITLIIMGRALHQGEVISQRTYAAMVIVSAVTCLAAPVVLRQLIRRWINPERIQETNE
jgi:Kef-type K+ transport system membrane component KefB